MFTDFIKCIGLTFKSYLVWVLLNLFLTLVLPELIEAGVHYWKKWIKREKDLEPLRMFDWGTAGCAIELMVGISLLGPIGTAVIIFYVIFGILPGLSGPNVVGGNVYVLDEEEKPEEEETEENNQSQEQQEGEEQNG